MKYAIKEDGREYITLAVNAPPARTRTLAEATQFNSLNELLWRAVHAGAWAQYTNSSYVHLSGGAKWFIIEVEEQAPKPTYTERLL